MEKVTEKKQQKICIIHCVKVLLFYNGVCFENDMYNMHTFIDQNYIYSTDLYHNLNGFHD